MPKLLSIKNFLGLNTMKRGLPPHQAREISDMVSERGLTKTRPGFGKYNVLAQSGAILGIFDYRRKNGQKGYLFADANGDWWEWEQFHFGWGTDNFWWTIFYEANELPTAAWPPWWAATGTVADPASESACSVSNGIATLTPSTSMIRYYPLAASVLQSGIPASNSVGNIMECRLKYTGPLGESFRMNISDGTKYCSIAVSTDHIRETVTEDTLYTMDTSTDYHIYKLTLKGTEAKLNIDGILRGVFTAGSDTNDYFQFRIDYDSGEPVQNTAYVDYVRLYMGGF